MEFVMTLPIVTRLACAMVFAAAAAAGSPGEAADLKKLTVVLSYVPDVETYGAEYALHAGYFKDEGLDVTLIPAGQGVDQVQMVASGTADIGITGPESILEGTEKGEKFKVFAAQFQKSPVAMTCRKDAGVLKPADLKGKRLGIKTTAKPFADLFLKKNGMSEADVTPTAIGGQDISLLIAGRIDCEITTFAFNEPMLIEQAGVPVNVLPLGEFGLNAQTNSYFVKDSFFSDPANQDLLVRYLRAELKAWQVYFKDPDAGAKFIVDGQFVDGLDMAQQKFQAEQQVVYMKDKLTAEKGLMWVDPDTWKETAENAFAAKITSKVMETSGMLTTAILEKANPPKM
jgi:NitT/TauT family transport system substrate-binding protein